MAFDRLRVLLNIILLYLTSTFNTHTPVQQQMAP